MSEVNNGMPQNTPTGKSVHTRSNFPLQYHKFDTMRFGEYHPHFVMEGVAKDKISFRSSHELRSYTLKAPLMEDISMKKDYFAVPMTAILPLNWDKFFANPVNGQDIPSSDVGPSSVNAYARFGTLMNNLYARFKVLLNGSNTTYTDLMTVTAALRFVVLGEYWYSTGSLLATLGCNLWRAFHVTDRSKTFDDEVEAICGVLRNVLEQIVVVTSNGSTRSFSTASYSSDPDVFSFRDLLQLFREDPGATVSYLAYVSGETVATMKSAFLSALLPETSGTPFGPVSTTDPFNLSRLAAYQLVCAQFYTNDSIDFVFDANRYRQLIWYYHRNLMANTSTFTDKFTMNGLTFDYDAFSAHVLDNILQSCIATSSTTLLYGNSSVQVTNLSYFSGLFAFRASLKFKDYFTGSHAHPLAVADSSFDASNTSVIDITKNIQKQRFLNAVNRVGGRIQDYMKEIFNSDLAPDYHDPFYIAHTSDVIYGSEVENTGSDQFSRESSVTSALRSNGSRYEFTYEPDRDCILIGLTYFDVARSYSRSIDRHFFHLDRFDWFNPYMQFIGDQKVYQEEIGTFGHTWNLSAFAYQLRHMEYKQRYNEASGGFIQNLPGWTFLADLKQSMNNAITPEFIRCTNSELDQFYVSLTGFSLGNYFHFIIKNTNDCSGSRPMAYAPTIL